MHHTWGVPIIPGSALKGICASYVARQVGGAEPEREPYRGVEWQGKRIVRGPGEIYAALFGAPDADNGAEAEQGGVAFHDALYVPDSTPGDRPFAVDVLTVHQRSYYGQMPGGGDPGLRWPNDYDSPNPVGFVTVRPGTKLLVALGGESKWTALACHLLGAALIRVRTPSRNRDVAIAQETVSEARTAQTCCGPANQHAVNLASRL